MNWTQPRKSYKSSEQAFSASKKIQTTCLNTPIFDKDYKSCKHSPKQCITTATKTKNCPYHFNSQDYVCLTCRKSICLRCAITYCQNHLVKQQKQIIPILVQDLLKIYKKQKVEEVQIKLGQSFQRQNYFQNKIPKLISKIQENFSSVIQTLNKKKTQIISHYEQQFQNYLHEYQEYDQLLKQKLLQLNSVQKQCNLFKNKSLQNQQKFTIQKIDELTNIVKQDSGIQKAEKRLNSLLISRNKSTIYKIWSQECLQKVLFEIEDIPYRMNKDGPSTEQIEVIEKKKRVITQSSDNKIKQNTSTQKSPGVKTVKGSGRIIYNKFKSGRKNKEQRFQKSQLL